MVVVSVVGVNEFMLQTSNLLAIARIVLILYLLAIASIGLILYFLCLMMPKEHMLYRSHARN